VYSIQYTVSAQYTVYSQCTVYSIQSVHSIQYLSSMYSNTSAIPPSVFTLCTSAWSASRPFNIGSYNPITRPVLLSTSPTLTIRNALGVCRSRVDLFVFVLVVFFVLAVLVNNSSMIFT
jgi:hypothetical protein